MNKDEIIAAIENVRDYDDAKKIVNVAIEHQKALHTVRNQKQKQNFKVGDEVCFIFRGESKTGILEKKNPSKCIIRVENESPGNHTVLYNGHYENMTLV